MSLLRETGNRKRWLALAAALPIALPGAIAGQPQQLDSAAVVEHIDAAVKARVDSIAAYTVNEHYAVFRNKDEAHPVAEMTVKTDYRQETGKSYTILSQSGSNLIRSLVLSAILDNEKHVNLPGVREGAWITSANYDMKLKSNATEQVGGRDCLVLSLSPKRKEPYLLAGTLWVDAKSYSIVQVKGTSSKSSSVFTGATDMMRQYQDVSGFSEATHARAVASSMLFGETVITIDYTGYQIQLHSAK